MDEQDELLLKKKYSRVKHVGQWETFAGFTEWMEENGWAGKKQALMRHDDTLPRTPENCYIRKKSNSDWQYTKAEAKEFEKSWAKAVNPLRRAARMPLLEVYD